MKRSSWRAATAAFVLVHALAGCATAPTAMTGAEDLETLEKDEARLWAMSDEIAASLEKSRALETDVEATRYLQDMMDSLFPEFDQAIRVHIIKNPEANAFAMANGYVYIHTGMLARLRNEAELAAVLGHEGAHFTERHVLERMRNAKNMSVFANVMGGLTGIGGTLASSLFAASSMSNLSQQNEAEADVIGLMRMSQLGYATEHAAKPFARLADELRARDIDEPNMFRSHPKLDLRAKSLTELAENLPGGEIHADRYMRSLGHLRIDALEQAVEMNQGALLVFLLAPQDQLGSYGNQAHFYLGEGYRLRSDGGDIERAKAAYSSAIDSGEHAARAHGKLGYLYMKEGAANDAIRHFESCLELDADSADAAYIKYYLNELRGAAE